MVRFVTAALAIGTMMASVDAYSNPSINTNRRVPFFVNIVEPTAEAATTQATARSTVNAEPRPSKEAPVPPKTEPAMDNLAAMAESPQAALETAQPPVKKTPAKKAGGAKHKEGVFSPVVKLAKTVLGDDNLNKVRGKVIGYHSKAIGFFVDTSDTPTGQLALKTLFELADIDKSGNIDQKELSVALRTLGFELTDKQIAGIFERADLNKDGSICWDEFRQAAPKTLKTNLTKLAKKNGNDMGLLS